MPIYHALSRSYLNSLRSSSYLEFCDLWFLWYPPPPPPRGSAPASDATTALRQSSSKSQTISLLRTFPSHLFPSISVLLLTVSHPILLNNMYTVSTSASTSTPASVCQGTPQGSVLRPLCFYIFTCTCSPFILLFMLMHCCPLVGSKCFQTENCICETTNKCNQREKEM